MRPALTQRIALVIAFNPWTRCQTTLEFEQAGYAVQEASNGFSGLRLARSVDPEVVVVAGDLPEVHADEVMHLLTGCLPRTEAQILRRPGPDASPATPRLIQPGEARP